MSDIFNISSAAVSAYQRTLGTVSNNIANVGTEGYVRQESKLEEICEKLRIAPDAMNTWHSILLELLVLKLA
jgi:flagellar basal body rod protein FlgG